MTVLAAYLRSVGVLGPGLAEPPPRAPPLPPPPPPLPGARPPAAPFGVALVLSPVADDHALAQLRAELAPGTAGRPAHAELAALAATNPAARSLLLLEAL